MPDSTVSPTSASPSLAWIARADDFGVSRGTNRAILSTLPRGIIRNVGLMACAPHITSDLSSLLQSAEKYDVALGLHAAITSEWQTPRWGALHFPTHPLLCSGPGKSFPCQTITLEACPIPAILQELRTQLSLLRKYRVPLTYLDTHMGFEWIPGLRDALLELCHSEGLVFGNPDPTAVFRPPDLTRPPQDFLQHLASSHHPFRISIFHPAQPDAETTALHLLDSPTTDHLPPRKAETNWLTHPNWPTALSTLPKIRPARYDEVLPRA